MSDLRPVLLARPRSCASLRSTSPGCIFWSDLTDSRCLHIWLDSRDLSSSPVPDRSVSPRIWPLSALHRSLPCEASLVHGGLRRVASGRYRRSIEASLCRIWPLSEVLQIYPKCSRASKGPSACADHGLPRVVSLCCYPCSVIRVVLPVVLPASLIASAPVFFSIITLRCPPPHHHPAAASTEACALIIDSRVSHFVAAVYWCGDHERSLLIAFYSY